MHAGMLFLAEACMVLLVPSVDQRFTRTLLLGWSVRLAYGAARAFLVCPDLMKDQVNLANLCLFACYPSSNCNYYFTLFAPIHLRAEDSVVLCDSQQNREKESIQCSDGTALFHAY
jgi:hypothetical protein